VRSLSFSNGIATPHRASFFMFSGLNTMSLAKFSHNLFGSFFLLVQFLLDPILQPRSARGAWP